MFRRYLTITLAVLCEACLAVHPAFADRTPLTVGFISILSGPYSDVGQAMANAAQMAVEEYGEAHPETKVRLLVEDDGADPKKALTAYFKLKEVDKADIILPISTFAIGVLRERVNQAKTLSLILGNEPYEPQDDYIYMLSPAAIPAERGLGEFVAAAHPDGKVLIVTSQNEAFFRFARAVQAGVGARAELLEVPAGLTDLGAIALRAKAKNPVAIVFNGFPLDTARMLKELHRLGFTPALYFDESIANSLSDLRTVLTELSLLKGAHILTLATDTDKNFTERYQKRFGVSPKIWTDYAYDAVRLALELKDREVEDARAWLRTNTYQGVSGKIRFDATGLRVADYSVIPLREHANFVGQIPE
jgi:branched-chain amino acid transport system substrate-binding protein